MIKKHQLKFCRFCKHQKYSFDQGLVCGLTNEFPVFKTTCPNYEEDFDLKIKIKTAQKKKYSNQIVASKTQRLINYLLDFVFIFILAIFLRWIFHLLVFFYPNQLTCYLHDLYIIKDILILATIYFYYYLIFEATTRRTLAKLITKTRVVHIDGRKPSFKQIFIRSWCRFIPFECITFYLNREGKGWHDRFSKTRVVKD